ncbi:hypothetical protein Leryth_002244 [Lithospermum erythrorhizon]|nr:hypothetical protein Leryth_002244 [Lithospermum erythrorhizon]
MDPNGPSSVMLLGAEDDYSADEINTKFGRETYSKNAKVQIWFRQPVNNDLSLGKVYHWWKCPSHYYQLRQ